MAADVPLGNGGASRHRPAANRRFGVVLIVRDSEVGDGDPRSPVGTPARIAAAEIPPDGRPLMITVGMSRLRVLERLPVDPHPQATVDRLNDPPGPAVAPLRPAARFRPMAALQPEPGHPASPMTPGLVNDDAGQTPAVSPVGPLDARRLPGADDPDRRIEEITRALDETEALLRLGLGR